MFLKTSACSAFTKFYLKEKEHKLYNFEFRFLLESASSIVINTLEMLHIFKEQRKHLTLLFGILLFFEQKGKVNLTCRDDEKVIKSSISSLVVFCRGSPFNKLPNAILKDSPNATRKVENINRETSFSLMKDKEKIYVCDV